MMVKTGTDNINSLSDGRTVYLDEQTVENVAEHPAYRNAVGTVARMYDFQAVPENQELMTFESPTTGERVNRCWAAAPLLRRAGAAEASADRLGGD